MHRRTGWWCPQPPPPMPLCASFPFHVLRKPKLALGCRLVSQGRASTGSISVPFGSYEPRSLHRSRARMSHWAAARGSVRAVLPAQQLPSHHSLESPNPSRPIQARVTITLIARDALGPQCNERKLLVVGRRLWIFQCGQADGRPSQRTGFALPRLLRRRHTRPKNTVFNCVPRATTVTMIVTAMR